MDTRDGHPRTPCEKESSRAPHIFSRTSPFFHQSPIMLLASLVTAAVVGFAPTPAAKPAAVRWSRVPAPAVANSLGRRQTQAAVAAGSFLGITALPANAEFDYPKISMMTTEERDAVRGSTLTLRQSTSSPSSKS